MHKFIAIEGIDGCGKSTILDLIKFDLANRGCIVQSPKDINDMHFHAVRSLDILKKLIWPPENWKSHAHIMPREYWMYLQAAWYSVQSEHFYNPMLRQDNQIITDGWVFKFMAKLAVDGFPAELIHSVFSNICQPDFVIMLDVSPDIIYQRKRGFSAYEKGSMVGKVSDDGNSFISYQKRVREELLRLAEFFNWYVLEVEKDETPVVTADRVLKLLI